MNGPTRRDPYRVAFEQAQSHLRQLSFELDTLDHRHAALLSVTTALEAMIAPRAGQNANQDSSTAAAKAPAAVAASKMPVTPAIEMFIASCPTRSSAASILPSGQGSTTAATARLAPNKRP